MIILPKRYQLTPMALEGGGMSDAVICRDQHLDRLVVIKSLKQDTDPERLLDELAALQGIRSKHVVQIYDVIKNSADAIHGIVEEYLPGVDLCLVAASLSLIDLLKTLYQIAEGISDIHGHGLIHRDIKPNNMKFDDEGCLKIFDFGLSRLENAGATTTNVVVSPGFGAPELYVAGPSGKVEFTQAVDVYAFGGTAMYLAMGDLPPDLQQLPPNLPANGADFAVAADGLPGEISSLLNACLESIPANRPSMAKIRDALAKHLLKDRHRALLVSEGQRYVLDSSNRVVRLGAQGLGGLRIRYDGQRFITNEISGYVSVNNMRITDDHEIVGSCVIILGSPDKGMRRVSITFDVAHPEVTL